MIFLIYIRNLTTIGPAVSEIRYLSNKNGYSYDTDRRKQETDFFRTVEVMKPRKNIKVAIRPMDSITIPVKRLGVQFTSYCKLIFS